jgi:hypothetical protein
VKRRVEGYWEELGIGELPSRVPRHGRRA